MKLCNVIVLLLLFAANKLEAQDKYLQTAEAYMEIHAYAEAQTYYRKSLKKRPDNAQALEGIAQAYFKQRKFIEALEWYEKLKEETGHTSLAYGQALFNTAQYREAKKVFQQLKNTNDSLINHYIVSCDSAQAWLKGRSRYKVESLEKANSHYSETAPVVYKEGVVFSSNRETLFLKKKSEANNAPLYDLYEIQKKNERKWKNPAYFSESINTLNHEGAAAFNGDYTEIILTRSNMYERGKQVHHLKLYKSSKGTLGWSTPLQFFLNDSTVSFGHPCLSKDGKYFFFSSDLPGGYGGTDIYLCVQIDSANWTAPYNMGPAINTPGNELYPHFSESEKIYFTSNGHVGMGGYDIYCAEIGEDGEYSVVRNMYPPINSSYDDLSIHMVEGEKSGYFSSNRPGGKGEEDIYFFRIK